MRWLLLSVASLTACATNVDVSPVTASDLGIVPDREIHYPVSFYISPDLSTARRNIEGDCSDSSVAAGPAIGSSIRDVNQALFREIVPGGTQSMPARGAGRHIVFTRGS